jgi:hypothetical protein
MPESRKECLLRPGRILWSLALLALPIGCSQGTPSPDGHTFTRSSENGVLVFTTSSVPRFLGPLFRYEEVARLHQDEGQAESLLYRAFNFIRGEDGRYYVEDRGNLRIAVFDPAGEFAGAIGRQGEGPGEFQSLSLLKVSNGEVAAYDSRLRRTTIFDLDGHLLKTHPSPISNNSTTELYPLAEDDYLLFTSTREGRFNEDRVTTPVALRVSSSGDTLFQVTTAPYLIVRTVLIRELNVGLQIVHPLAERGGFYFKPGRGFLAYQTGQPELKWYDLDGRLASVIRMKVERERVTELERAAILSRLDEHIEQAENDRDRIIARATREGTVIPEYKPFWMSISVEEDGHIWLEKVYDMNLPTEDRDPATYRLLSSEGEYLGDTTPPVSGGTFSRGHYLVRLTDPDTDEPSYVIYRLIPDVEGFRYPN